MKKTPRQGGPRFYEPNFNQKTVVGDTRFDAVLHIKVSHAFL